MGINEIVTVNITRESIKVTQLGFGIPLVLGQHTAFAERIREYTSLEAVAEDFLPADLEFKKAQALFAQDVSPESIKIGRRDANAQQVNNVTVPTISANTTYTVTINGIDFDFLSGGTPTAASIVDGLVAAITAGTEPVGTTDNGDDFDITADTAGEGFSIATTANLAFTTTQANVSVVTEIIAVQAIDPDWYFVILTSKTKFDILQLADYVETQKKQYFALTNDSDVKQLVPHIQTLTLDADIVTANTVDLKVDAVSIAQVTFTTDHDTTMGLLAQAIQDLSSVETATVTGAREITVTGSTPGALIPITDVLIAGGASQANTVVATTQEPANDVASLLEAKSLDRTALMHTEDTDNDVEAAWVGLNAPEDPGSITWAFKSLSGVIVDTLTDTEKSNIHGKNANTYTQVAGVNITQNGTVSSGEFIDIIRGTDFIQARMEEAIFAAIATSKKIPYTNQGIDVIRSIVTAQLQLAIDQGILAESPAPVVTAPDISEVSQADKNARVLRNVKFTATFASAVHKVEIEGNITV